MIKVDRKILANLITDAIRNEYGNSNYSALVALNSFDSYSYWFTKEEAKVIDDFVKNNKLESSSPFFDKKWSKFGRVVGVIAATKVDPSPFIPLGAAFESSSNFWYLYLSALNYHICNDDSLLSTTDFENLVFGNYDKLDRIWTRNILNKLIYDRNSNYDYQKWNELQNIRDFLLDYSKKFGDTFEE